MSETVRPLMFNCPHCGAEVTEYTVTCPSCGRAITTMSRNFGGINVTVNNTFGKKVARPQTQYSYKAPDIGTQLPRMGTGTAFLAHYAESSDLPVDLPFGDVDVKLFTSGIRISSGMKDLDIQRSQVTGMHCLAMDEDGLEGHSRSGEILGRAMLGHIVAGHKGALAGAISGMKGSGSPSYECEVVIEFTTDDGIPADIVLYCGNRTAAESFIDRFRNGPFTETKEDRGCLVTMVVGMVLLVLLMVYVLCR